MTAPPGGQPLRSSVLVSPEHAGLRADVFLSLIFPRLSRTRIRQKIQQGESFLNGRRYASSARVREGDQIVLHWRGAPQGASRSTGEGPGAPPGPPGVAMAAPGIAPLVLFEDEHLMAVDKPAGIAVHPTGSIQSGTLIQWVRERLAKEIAESLARGDESFYPRLVNRLDMLTSGIVLVAKRRETLVAMQGLSRSGGIIKGYLALVEGVVDPPEGRIELALGLAAAAESKVGIRMTVQPDGLPCVTEYRTVSRVGANTLLAAQPLTGRQHQIRAHLAAIGHPVWGDLLYKDEKLFLSYWENGRGRAAGRRHALHAEAVSFTHPVSGMPVEIRCPAPDDFLRLLEEARAP